MKICRKQHSELFDSMRQPPLMGVEASLIVPINVGSCKLYTHSYGSDILFDSSHKYGQLQTTRSVFTFAIPFDSTHKYGQLQTVCHKTHIYRDFRQIFNKSCLSAVKSAATCNFYLYHYNTNLLSKLLSIKSLIE